LSSRLTRTSAYLQKETSCLKALPKKRVTSEINWCTFRPFNNVAGDVLIGVYGIGVYTFSAFGVGVLVGCSDRAWWR
jgi:hypothetical protein